MTAFGKWSERERDSVLQMCDMKLFATVFEICLDAKELF